MTDVKTEDRSCVKAVVRESPGRRWLPVIQDVMEKRGVTFEHASSIVSACVGDGTIREERRNVRWISARASTFEAYLWPSAERAEP